MEAWRDKRLLKKCVENRFIYSSSLSSQSIANGFNACKLAPKVSVFSASTSKYLIQKYLDEYNTIFDPFSGFSGRMLGTCACGKKYVGQDISEEHIHESLDISHFHNLDVQLSVQDIMSDSRRSYECLFTCPPYSNKEVWGEETIFKSCDEWIDICIEKYNCDKYLFVVDDTDKYKDCIVETLKNKSHFGINKEYVVMISFSDTQICN